MKLFDEFDSISIVTTTNICKEKRLFQEEAARHRTEVVLQKTYEIHVTRWNTSQMQ